ncbi:MAG: HEAT repeat domain-containing protein [Planctomycetota bacterium]|nr:HEAT repeat domain-containing protein [Planctomycetota bacterium]
MTLATVSRAQEAQWIWSPEHQKGSVPLGACHFRKQVVVAVPVSGEITITADDDYDLYVNGRRVASGKTSGKPQKHDLTEFLSRGQNLVAVKVTNAQGSTAGLAARIRIKDETRGWVSFTTDATWLTSLHPLPFWYTSLYNDSRWAEAKSFGSLKEAAPQDPKKETAVARSEKLQLPAPPKNPAPQPQPIAADEHEHEPQRADAQTPAEQSHQHEAQAKPSSEQLVKVLPDFQVERLLDNSDVGSLIAMTFNEFGHLIAARENGGLVLLYDSDRNGDLDRVREYCDLVKNCRGLLCLNGEVFVTGEGPDGLGLYRLTDKKRTGRLDEIQTVLKFRGKSNEFGPHGLALGIDGWLYVALGNQTQPEQGYDANSPHQNYYEGDLLQPRYEDPMDHQPSNKVPGGVILRTDLKGEKVQLVAGGFRNATDVAFNSEGELFTQDGGADFDAGTPWHRASRVQHVIPGAEFGWRSGWAKWPEYYADNLPATLDTGHFAPAGAVFYGHYLFPEKYHDALFVADGAAGRILAVTLTPGGGTYTATSEILLDSEGLGITGLDVAPDGGLYFVTGGSGKPGGVYRIKWLGKPVPGAADLGRGLSAVIRQPQLNSAWSRQQVAALKTQIGKDWERLLHGVAISPANPWRYRTRALDLLQLYAPAPDDELLVRLTQDETEQVRAKAVELMGLRGSDATHTALTNLLDDSDVLVRRRVCEALVRRGQAVPVEKLTQLLKSEDRYLVWAARRLLERLPVKQWRDELLNSDNQRVVIESALALLIGHPDKEVATQVLDRLLAMMGGYVSDRDFVDMLRVMQVALVRGPIPAEEAARARERLANEYPSNDHGINRELVRLLVHLQEPSVVDRYLTQLRAESVPDPDKLHLAMHLRFLEQGWTPAQRTQVLEFFEDAQKKSGGHSYAAYVSNASRDFARGMSVEEARQIVAEGTRWPSAAVGALYKLPQQVDDELLETLKKINEQLLDATDLPRMRLKVGIVAVLARGGAPNCLAYLRQLWEVDPERRPAIAMGLAQWPSEENWTYLVRSLPFLEGDAAREVLVKLKSVTLAPEDPEYFRAVIVRGLKLQGAGAEDAIALLEYWTDETTKAEGDWKVKLAEWQKYYAEKFPEAPEAVLAEEREESKWKLPELLRHLNSVDANQGSAARGATVFAKSLCARCHRYGDLGDADGLDLTTVSKRLMRKEIIESVLYPSHMIPSDHTTKTVITASGRVVSGMVNVTSTGDALVRQSDGTEVTVLQSEVDEIRLNRASDMPTGLLDSLTFQEVTDLFVFLGSRPDELLTKKDDGKVQR